MVTRNQWARYITKKEATTAGIYDIRMAVDKSIKVYFREQRIVKYIRYFGAAGKIKII